MRELSDALGLEMNSVELRSQAKKNRKRDYNIALNGSEVGKM